MLFDCIYFPYILMIRFYCDREDLSLICLTVSEHHDLNLCNCLNLKVRFYFKTWDIMICGRHNDRKIYEKNGTAWSVSLLFSEIYLSLLSSLDICMVSIPTSCWEPTTLRKLTILSRWTTMSQYLLVMKL